MWRNPPFESSGGLLRSGDLGRKEGRGEDKKDVEIGIALFLFDICYLLLQ